MNVWELTFHLVTKFKDVFKIYENIFSLSWVYVGDLLNMFYGTGMFIFGSNESSKPN
jgi:hypothetical protein